MSRWLTFRIQREPGFRLNLTDLVLIGGLCALAASLHGSIRESGIWGLPLYVGTSFFCFCNIFRIGNRLEVIWYVPFVLFVTHDMGDFKVDWPLLLLLFEPLKAFLIGYRMLRGPYHGVFHEAINRWRGRTG